ncbi:TlpA disulfide reductase family protein [Dyadobacter sp. 3J3]|uniref:TlpA family protein disulfide reductase n=1 Tax=Dyadobacter sp. 3J3 TaxID=2606600 RepID=UPI0013593048|nr:TlpA disulfide reductase family protein [Dyadobacter sp. 3J3]
MNSRFCSSGKVLPCLFYFSLLYLLLWCWEPLRAQTISQLSPLKIGDTVPDFTITNVLHHDSDQLKRSDFKGKLLILDFWATWCSPCVAAIPLMDSLQRQFQGRVQFLPVAYQLDQEITRFRDRLARQKGWRIETPEVVGDTQLSTLFPHNVYPHYVWIDEAGIVRAITNGDEVTAANIARILETGSTGLALKNDQDRPVYDNTTTPLAEFLARNTDKYAETYHSVSTPYIEGLPGGYHIDNPGEEHMPYRITFTNISPLWLFKIAFGEARQFFGDGFFAVEVHDPGKVECHASGSEASDWFRQNAVCYELVVPYKLKENVWEIFRQDLQRLFPQYEAMVEKRNKNALVLIRTSAADKLKAKSGAFSETQDGLSLRIRSGTLSGFVTNLNVFNMSSSPLPLVDRTGYTGNIDLDIEANMSDIRSLNSALARYDIQFIKKQIDLDMLVIRDKLTPAQSH